MNVFMKSLGCLSRLSSEAMFGGLYIGVQKTMNVLRGSLGCQSRSSSESIFEGLYLWCFQKRIIALRTFCGCLSRLNSEAISAGLFIGELHIDERFKDIVWVRIPLEFALCW